jgi:DNA-binding NarL/FixJ family response regulator
LRIPVDFFRCRKCVRTCCYSTCACPAWMASPCCTRWRGYQNPPRVIVLTSFEKEEDIYRAIRAGAHGYLLKDTTEAEMVAALRTVRSGKRYIPRPIAARRRPHASWRS